MTGAKMKAHLLGSLGRCDVSALSSSKAVSSGLVSERTALDRVRAQGNTQKRGPFRGCGLSAARGTLQLEATFTGILPLAPYS